MKLEPRERVALPGWESVQRQAEHTAIAFATVAGREDSKILARSTALPKGASQAMNCSATRRLQDAERTIGKPKARSRS